MPADALVNLGASATIVMVLMPPEPEYSEFSIRRVNFIPNMDKQLQQLQSVWN